MEKIKKVVEEELIKEGLRIDEITYKNHELCIVIDSDDAITIDMIVKATKIINPILDKHDFIKEKYTLDVMSKIKGGN